MAALAPVAEGQRVAALDVARGIAVLGVLLMNIWAFAGPQAFFDYPRALAGRAGEPVLTWIVVHTLFEGSQRTLLSLLFGAGVAIALARFGAMDPGAARGTYYRRTAGLIALGLVNAYVFLWPADILFIYGLAGLCLYPLHRLRSGTLLAIALAALAVPALLRVAEIRELRATELAALAATAARDAGRPLAAEQARAVGDWEEELRKARPSADDPKLAAEIAAMQDGSLPQVAARQARVSLILQTIVGLKWWFLDALAMMIIGMVLQRAGVFGGGGTARRAARLMAAGLLVGLPLAAWQTSTLLALDFHPVTSVVTKLTYDVRRLATALGYLGLILLFCQAAAGLAVKGALAAVGRMALTNYLAQSILCALVFYGFGLGLYGRVTGYWLYAVVAAIWALEIAWSVAWLRRFRVGPFEWAWRSFTYRKRQPWRAAEA